jgi:hypothetical protein
MLAPVLDPDLRDLAWQCMRAVAAADGEVCDSESIVVAYVRRRWALGDDADGRAEQRLAH